jgi:hypothetical protein
MIKKILTGCIAFLMLILIMACESEKRFPPRGYLPVTPGATEQLEAAYFWVAQDALNSPYWNDAGFVEVLLSNGETGNLYGDGYLNMTGTYAGLSDFNRGNDPQVMLKAGYDDEFLYLLVEWKDTTADASYMTRLFLGPEDTEKPGENAEGWTSQRNQDSFVILFDNDQGVTDAWKWSLASTAPLNMALDLSADDDGRVIDDSNLLIPNSAGMDARSGPQFEWSGARQEITLWDGTRRLLDPAYYLLNIDSMKIGYAGSVEAGRTAFNVTAHCNFCHGDDGNGDAEGSNGGSLNRVFTNRYSREGLREYIGSPGHEGRGPQYWGRIRNDDEAVTDLITFLRAIAGVPGNLIDIPGEEPEIKALTNIGVGSISERNSSYRVLLKRRLVSVQPGNIRFVPGTSYTLSIRLSDNDDMNYVSSGQIQLVFNTNDL